MNMVYRAYRVPYEWVPQLDRPQETAIAPIDVTTFRVPGAARPVPKPKLPSKAPCPTSRLRRCAWYPTRMRRNSGLLG